MLSELQKTIKNNCDVSDAKFWGYFSVCGLLMRYRDLYRTEQGLEPWSPIPRDEISAWIQRKEAAWPRLENEGFRNLSFRGRDYDPFDAPGINDALNGEGLAYGAGYGMYLKPTFFLARLRSVGEIDGHRVITTDREMVRDLFSAPAMLQERTIFLRRDALRALLWDKYTQVRPGPPTPLADAFASFGVHPGGDGAGPFVEKAELLCDLYAEVLLRHELAESRVSAGSRWKELLAAAGDRSAELALRALQDLVADTSPGGPLDGIVAARDERSLAFFVGMLDGFRKSLFPELRAAYGRFRRDADWRALAGVLQECHGRFSAARQRVLDLEGPDRKGIHTAIQELMSQAGSCAASPAS
ncbi:MAG: hypothetical protein M0042_02570 [Nitrospiraceae bacterium]|nr:hypothetical protein [Nitrospiraceae bacterium]